MFGAFANTLKVPELRKRIFFTLGLVLICRLITLIPTPGVDLTALKTAIDGMRDTESTSGGILGMLDIFSGGAMERCSVGTLGIWPYISASIILQLMTAIIPSLERMVRDGETGRQKMNQWTKYFTIVICLFQGFFLAKTMESNFLGLGNAAGDIVPVKGFGFEFITVISMTAASMLVMWLGDQITSRGIGNGISLIIMINICSRLPHAIQQIWSRYFSASASKNLFELAILLLVGFLVCAFTVMLTLGVRKVTIHAARRTVGAKTYGGQATYIPLRVNFTGVMPIIFAGPLLQIPGGLLKRINPSEDSSFYGLLSALKKFGVMMDEQTNVTYIILFSLLVLFFSFFWVATQFNAVRISEDFKRGGSYIPGIRPGHATAEFLDHTMSRVTLIGAVGLIIVAILPTILMSWMKMPYIVAGFFGGTSLLIIVGVALDTLRQMESLLVMRHYDGFLKHGRIQSRIGGM